jgi:hypothetical protein
MNQYFKISMAGAILLLATASNAYQNECATLFQNGLESHAIGKINFGLYSSMHNGSPLLNAGVVNQLLNSSACGTQKCQASGVAAPAFPEFTAFDGWSLSLWGHQSYPSHIIGFNDVEEFSANGSIRIEDLSLLAFSELALTPGDYWIDELYVGMYSKLTLKSPGQVRIFTRQLDVKAGAYIGDSEHPFIIYSGESDYSSSVTADVFNYSNDTINVNSNTTINGALSANDIDIDIDSDIYFDLNKAHNLDFGWICDYDNDGIYDRIDEDSDNDGVPDNVEELAGTDIYDNESIPADSDGDGISDVVDTDIDGDGVDNGNDAFPRDPNEATDTDGDNIGNNADTDDDNDGYTDTDEVAAGTDPLDASSVPEDNDSDGVSDVTDTDDDNDGVNDENDAFPNDATETIDTDGDNIGNNADTDDDNDGYTDTDEVAAGSDPLNADSVPLILTVGQESGGAVYSSNYQVSGLVSASDLSRIELSVSNGTSTRLIPVSGAGYFSTTVKLNVGSNDLRVLVSDDVGNVASEELSVTFTPPFTVLSSSPASGEVLTGIEQSVSVMISVEDGEVPSLRISGVLAGSTEISEGRFQYLADIVLLPGDNEVDIQAIAGEWSVNDTLHYRAEPEDLTDYLPPVFDRFLPIDTSRTAADSVSIYAELSSEVGRLSATVNGEVMALSQNTDKAHVMRFTYPLTEGNNVIEVVATDALNQSSSRSVEVIQDKQAPVIELTSPWLVPPTVNELSSPALTISGKVIANDVKSLTLNGRSVTLTETQGGYEFTQNLVVTPLSETYVELVAKDDLGNQETLGLSFFAATALELAWLTPQFPVTWYSEQGTGYPFALQATGANGNETYTAMLVPGDIPVSLTKIGIDTITGTLPSQLTKDEYQLVVTATSGAYQTQLAGAISVLDLADIPLEIISTEPEMNGSGYEPDTALVVNFNRPVDPQAISFDVKRTLHGKTYANKDKPGIEFFNAKGAVLEEVHVSREQVTGGLSWIEGNRTVIFYPQNDLGYGAEVYWDVFENDEIVDRLYFETRSLPTFINGAVKDSLGRTRTGVSVKIKELGLTSITNTDGGFSFGYNTPANENIADGEYTLVINPDRMIPELGEIEIPVSIKGGARNSLSIMSVPNVDLSIPMTGYQQGASELWLASGDIKLGLEATGLLFPDDSNAIHTQFIPMSSNVRPVDPDLAVFWMYQTQPFGITPVDAVEIEISLPKYRGTHNYLLGGQESEYWVLLVAYNPIKNMIEPVGVGSISGTKLTSHGAIEIPTLDYLGYATPLPEHQQLFEQYLAGQMSFQELVFRVKTERPQ